MSKRTIVRRLARKGSAEKNPKPKQALPLENAEAAPWQQLYILSGRWESDLIFFQDEVNFLRKLIDTYFMGLVHDDHIERTRKLMSDLSKLEKRRSVILQKLKHHRSNLVALIGNPFSHSAQDCKDRHAEMEASFAGFAKEFRETKKEVFDLTETVIASEKAKHLLGGT